MDSINDKTTPTENAKSTQTDLNHIIKDRIYEVIQREALTSGMMVDSAFVEATSNAGEVRFAEFTTSGLGNYDRQFGYPSSSATIAWTPNKLQYSIEIHIDVDKKDKHKSGNFATIAALATYQTKHHAIPEIDATRIAKVAQEVESKYATNYVTTSLTPANILNELDNAISTVFDTTGIDSGLQIYVNNNLRGVLNQTTQVTRTKDVAGGSRNINLATKEIDGMPITFMPSSRMYPAIDSLTINGTNDRGCVKSADSANVNFIIAVPGAINAIVDVNGSKYSPKTDDHTEDVDRFVFHIFHDVFIPKQSAKGIYVSIGS